MRAACVSIDWKTSLDWALKNINDNVITQGNLDPHCFHVIIYLP